MGREWEVGARGSKVLSDLAKVTIHAIWLVGTVATGSLWNEKGWVQSRV